MDKKILHIDVNNAFLSWTALDRLANGEELDLRTVPAIIGGDEASRHGIVVAKSNIAKKFRNKDCRTDLFSQKEMPKCYCYSC